MKTLAVFLFAASCACAQFGQTPWKKSGGVISPKDPNATVSIGATVLGGTLRTTFTNQGYPLGTASACGYAERGGTLTSVTLTGDGTTGNATVDITSATLAQFLAGTPGTSITGGAPASFASAKGVNVTTFSGWTATITAGNVYCFTLTAPSSITSLSVVASYRY